jgi:hypothetical protein
MSEHIFIKLHLEDETKCENNQCDRSHHYGYINKDYLDKLGVEKHANRPTGRDADTPAEE